jgi:hypothetical protein
LPDHHRQQKKKKVAKEKTDLGGSQAQRTAFLLVGIGGRACFAFWVDLLWLLLFFVSLVFGVMGEDGKAIGGVGGGELLLPPALVEEQEGVREAMQLAAELCKHFYSQGWVSGTGGSITLKVHNPLVPLSERHIVMAPSGRVSLSLTHTLFCLLCACQNPYLLSLLACCEAPLDACLWAVFTVNFLLCVS